MKKIIETIPYKDQRYETLGDYYEEDGVMKFKISDVGNKLMEFAIGIHEQIEEFFTRTEGISEKHIMEFDLMFEEERKAGLHSDTDEPGADPRSPYREQHEFAENIERLIIHRGGLNWNDYTKYINSL